MKTLKHFWFNYTGREIDTDEIEAFKQWLKQFDFDKNPLSPPCSVYDNLNRVAGNRRIKAILANLESKT